MSENRIIVHAIHLSDHPTSTHLQIGKVGEHQVVVGRHYYEGQLGFYIPDGAVVPHTLLEHMWLVGKLAGKKKNRVKSREMYGVRSDGLFYGSQGEAWNPSWKEGDDITDQLTGELEILFPQASE